MTSAVPVPKPGPELGPDIAYFKDLYFVQLLILLCHQHTAMLNMLCESVAKVSGAKKWSQTGRNRVCSEEEGRE